MRIVALDGFTLNPGDLTWDGLKQLGDVTIYDRTSSELTVDRASGAEIVLTNKTIIDERVLEQLPELRYLGVLATGYNVVDVDAASSRGIIVTNIPTYGTSSVAQMTFALLLEMTQHVQAHYDAVKSGQWSNCPDFCFWNYPLIELAGKTMGIIGFGRIGQNVADIATAFGMNIIAHDSFKSDQSRRTNFKWGDLDELLSESDVVTLHCPLLPETKGIINTASLCKMKKTTLLINTSRGPLIIDEDLAEALNNGIIAGAGVDVLSIEPPRDDNPLLSAKNCLVTPHISWATYDARKRLMSIAMDNLKAWLAGKPVNIVNN